MNSLVFSIVTVLAVVASCRQDGDDEAFSLKWSCARVHNTGAAIATPECLQQMTQAKDPALKQYKAVPQRVDGRITQYALVEKSQPH